MACPWRSKECEAVGMAAASCPVCDGNACPLLPREKPRYVLESPDGKERMEVAVGEHTSFMGVPIVVVRVDGEMVVFRRTSSLLLPQPSILMRILTWCRRQVWQYRIE